MNAVQLFVELDEWTPTSVAIDGLSQLGNCVAVPCFLIGLFGNRLVAVVSLAVLAFWLLLLLLGFGLFGDGTVLDGRGVCFCGPASCRAGLLCVRSLLVVGGRSAVFFAGLGFGSVSVSVTFVV